MSRAISYAHTRAMADVKHDRIMGELWQFPCARIVVPETPVRVKYELTPKGRALEHPLAAIGKWAERWIDLEAAEPARRACHRRET